MGELAKTVGFAVIFAGLVALVWAGVYWLRSKQRIGSAVSFVLVGAIGLAIYAWLGRGFYLMNAYELEDLARPDVTRHYPQGIERARAEYYYTAEASPRYTDEKGVERTFSPSREDRIRRARHAARLERLASGAQRSHLVMYAALAAVPLAVVGGLLWPRRPASPLPAAAAAPARSRFFPSVFELLIVAAIIGFLAAIAEDPSDWNLAAGTTVRNAAVKLELLKPQIAEFYRSRNRWPQKHADLGLPEEGYMVTSHNYTFALQGDGGVLLKTRWGNASFRPALDAKGEIAWLCAHEPAPEGFRVVGENRTTLPVSHLPGECRAR